MVRWLDGLSLGFNGLWFRARITPLGVTGLVEIDGRDAGSHAVGVRGKSTLRITTETKKITQYRKVMHLTHCCCVCVFN